MVFFSKKLERIIEKVWRKGPYYWVKGKEEKQASRETGDKGKEEAFANRKKAKGQERRGEDYDPTNYVYVWEMGVKRRKWERAEEYFGMMSEYERAGESGCNTEYGARILEEI